MKKLTSLFATCILVLSLSGIALADGGNTHGPGLPPPPPSGGETSSASATAESQYYNALSELTLLMTWFEQSIL